MSDRELHPVLTPERRRELIQQGTERFNSGEYFAAHEAWEEIWRSTTPEPRDLFQGLVQLSAAFHHLHERKRSDVARRVLARARRRLAALPEWTEGLDLAALLEKLAAWDEWLAASGNRIPPPLRLLWPGPR